jgi:ribosomal protein L7/L12
MKTVFLCLFAFLALLALFIGTGKRRPLRPASKLPAPSIGVELLARDSKVIDAIKLYRKETGCSLHEAKQVVDHILGKSREA